MDKIQDFEVKSPRWLSLEDFEGEYWKDVVGYESLYIVSNYGRVKNLKCNKGFWNHNTPFIIKPFIQKHRCDYLKVFLYKDGQRKSKFVHRLVAEAFLPNPDNLPEVNHKDENKRNPHLDNLEWCTRKYNSNYGTMPKRMAEYMKGRKRESVINNNKRGLKHKEVHQYDLNGKYIATYYSLIEAGRITGINPNNICDTCKGRSLSAGGFIWTYTKEENEIAVRTNLAKGRKGRRRKNVLPIGKYTLDNKYICTYVNASVAARAVGVHYSSILRCAQGKYKQCGGFVWKYEMP